MIKGKKKTQERFEEAQKVFSTANKADVGKAKAAVSSDVKEASFITMSKPPPPSNSFLCGLEECMVEGGGCCVGSGYFLFNNLNSASL